ncbi:MAG TPA: chromate efflux transporter [Noviherbaspirillum sp.]|nr:chromate efflux transporter [Noviherbaspirillum sp.]
MPGMHEVGAESAPHRIGLTELAWIFFRIACTSYGGFMAMIAVVQNVVVERRRLLADEDILEGLSLASILPGPTAINVVAYVGYRLRGVAGAVVCAGAAILPPFALMAVAGFAYFRWGNLPVVDKVFLSMTPAVVAIVVTAAWRMCRTSVASTKEGVIAAGAVAATLCVTGVYTTVAVMAAAALAGWLMFGERRKQGKRADTLPVNSRRSTERPVWYANPGLMILAVLPAAISQLPHMESNLVIKLFGVFAGMSMLMFGGGYVFIPLFQQVVVDGYGWVTQQEFVDALTLGQVTPGPIMISATFIGYKVAGLAGAFAATFGMFAPSAALMVFCTRLFARIRASVNAQAMLRGVRAAATGMVFAAAVMIGKSMAPHWISAAVFGISMVALMRYRIEAVWVVPAAGAVGLFI